MTVVLRHNEELELNRAEYHGSVTLAELIALAEFNSANPTWLTYDSLSLVTPGAHFRSIDKATLDTIFARYRAAFEPLHFLILRRSAWLCQSDAAAWLAYDCLNFIPPGGNFETVAFADLDAIFAKYRMLFEPRQLAIFRRSAWIYQSPAALRHVSHWIGGRNLRQGMSSDVRLLESFTAAAEWLVLPPDLISILETGEDFAEVARYHIPASRAAAR